MSAILQTDPLDKNLSSLNLDGYLNNYLRNCSGALSSLDNLEVAGL